MATNSGRGNPIAAVEGKDVVENTPPPVSQDTKAQVSEMSSSVHSAGQDAGAASTSGASKVEIPEEVKGSTPGGQGNDSR